MKFWNQAPLTRLLLPFLVGILTAISFPIQLKYSEAIIFTLVFITSSILLIPKLNFSFKNSWWLGLLINFTLFVVAYELTILKTEKFYPNHFSNYANSASLVYAKLNTSSLEKEKSVKIILDILAVKQGNEWKNTSGKAIVYLQKDTAALLLKYGDELLLKNHFKEILTTQNPEEFNYKQFLAYQNINHQAYIKNNEWIVSNENSGNVIINYCLIFRNNLLKTLKKCHLTKDEFSVGAALLLGYEDDLDRNIISSYANTGALHILSVSGLHVAIVYFVFNWLLFFLDKIKYGNIFKALLLILFLWFYAALTGLSPSVLRAATMFSFIVIAKAFNRNTNIYNTLAASAFLLLIINPYLMMDVGFQLSYIAVIGIVYIQPKIYSWFEINNWLLNQLWLITSVSIAAQIATFPLGLFYFHQFPNYFLIANFIVIPISTLIIYIGIALFAFAKISLVTFYLGVGFKWSVWLLNTSVQTIEKWPNALLQGISISPIETGFIYILILFVFLYLQKPKFKYLLVLFCNAILFICTQITEQHLQLNQKIIIVYNLQKNSAVDFVNGKNNVLLTDNTFAKDENNIRFHIKNNWWKLGVINTQIVSDSIKTATLKIKNNTIQFYNKKIVVVNQKESSNYSPIQPLRINYLILSKNATTHIADILKQYKADTIIFDSSNSNYKINKWKQECNELNQKYYSVKSQGALIVNL